MVLPVAVASSLVCLAVINMTLVKAWPGWPEDGVLWSQNGANVIAAEVNERGSGRRSGVRPGDVLVAISTSGGSANVVAALAVARRRGLRTIALTGRDGGEAGRAAEIHINVPSPSTARVQEVHRTLLHVICELVENAFVA